MTDAGTIISGYGLTFVAVAGYGAWVLLRGRALGHRLGIGQTTPDSEPLVERPDEGAGDTERGPRGPRLASTVARSATGPAPDSRTDPDADPAQP